MHEPARFCWLLLLALGITAALGACHPSPTGGGISPQTPSLTPGKASPTAAPSPSATPTYLPSPSPSPTAHPSATPALINSPTPPACLKSSGRIEMGRLKTDLLRFPLEFRVYLPPCYAQHTEQRYPVLYLIHGQSYTDDQWDRLGADETADALIAAGEAPPFLIVMPRDRVWSQPTEDAFGQAVIEELLPWIDAHYRTMPAREYRAVGGLSRGASWAIHLGLSAWESFGAIGAHSLPVFWTDLPNIRKWLD
ncbi:MAG TPA: alpha/beta hydrolase-fold protein, partial [Anaerolineales bacterium]|nr:alpha/beta hydrolase-fold protein [Anaerolineales bacterium]